MAIVELRPPQNRRLPVPRDSAARASGMLPSPALPKNAAKIEVGPIVIEVRESGDFLIYTQETRPVTTRSGECDVTVRRTIGSVTNRLLVKPEDVDDLMVALDGALEKRPLRK
jgi:hypothetical protein